MVIKIDDCVTTLLFPFVTNQLGFNTGLVITNASDRNPAPAPSSTAVPMLLMI